MRMGTVAVFGCAAGAPVSQTLPATEPAPTDRPTLVYVPTMARPLLLESPGNSVTPAITREFRTNPPSGRVTLTVRCVITVEGLVRGCVIVESIPSEDREVLQWLGQVRYRPTTVDGLPIQISYVFHFKFCAGYGC